MPPVEIMILWIGSSVFFTILLIVVRASNAACIENLVTGTASCESKISQKPNKFGYKTVPQQLSLRFYKGTQAVSLDSWF
jgi:hypothetical protein